MSELTELEDDRYQTDQSEICAECGLPKMISTYALGMGLLRRQLIELKQALVEMAGRIDALDKRDIH